MKERTNEQVIKWVNYLKKNELMDERNKWKNRKKEGIKKER